jgi:hypothetical protein
MNTVKHIGIIFLLFIFLFSTTGISILHHICNSSQNDEVTVYPELFKGHGSSCCEADESESACDIQSGADAHIPQNINAMPCCINIKSYLKLHFVTERSEKLVINTVTTALPQFSQPLPEATVNASIIVPPHFFQFYSPPLFGKRLIHFLHQSKIPAHPVLS